MLFKRKDEHPTAEADMGRARPSILVLLLAKGMVGFQENVAQQIPLLLRNTAF